MTASQTPSRTLSFPGKVWNIGARMNVDGPMPTPLPFTAQVVVEPRVPIPVPKQNNDALFLAAMWTMWTMFVVVFVVVFAATMTLLKKKVK